MDEHSITLISILIILVGLSAFFSSTETAFSSMSRARIKTMAQEGVKNARLAYKLSENYDELISTILIGNNIVNIAAATLATILFVGFFQDNGATVSTVVMTIVVLIFGEVTPKSLAKENPESYSIAVAPVMNVLIVIFKPINFLLVKFKTMIGKLFKIKGTTTITENEIITLVEEAEQVGGIEEHERDLIKNAIEFDDLEAIDIITPRINVVAIDVVTEKDEILRMFRETGYSRFPVFEGTVDSIVGIINEKDFHNHMMYENATIDSIIKPVEFVPPSMKISELLKIFQKKKLHLAVIVDEFGGTEGIVTLEDILEELVGDIWDEHDEMAASILDIGDSEYLVPTSTDLDELFEKFKIVDEIEASTVNGWVIENIDKIPAVGDNFDFDNLSILVTKVESKRATELKIKVNYEKVDDENDKL